MTRRAGESACSTHLLRVAAYACAVLAGCAPAPNGTGQQQEPRDASVQATSHVTMERGPCFGTCPVYRIDVVADGTVRFEGRRFTGQAGVATARIEPAAAAELLHSLEADGFFALADRYTHGEKTCGAYHTDAPHVTVSVQLDGRTKSVEHDHGCADAPAALRAMQARIDSVANVARWVGR